MPPLFQPEVVEQPEAPPEDPNLVRIHVKRATVEAPWGFGLSSTGEVMELDIGGIAQRSGIQKGMVLIRVNDESVVPDDALPEEQCIERITQGLDNLQAHLVFRKKVCV